MGVRSARHRFMPSRLVFPGGRVDPADARTAVYRDLDPEVATRLGRQARAIELAPSYTDVAVKRFQQNHPDIPVTLLATGQTFAEVEAERRISSGSAPAETRSDPLLPDRRRFLKTMQFSFKIPE